MYLLQQHVLSGKKRGNQSLLCGTEGTFTIQNKRFLINSISKQF